MDSLLHCFRRKRINHRHDRHAVGGFEVEEPSGVDSEHIRRVRLQFDRQNGGSLVKPPRFRARFRELARQSAERTPRMTSHGHIAVERHSQFRYAASLNVFRAVFRLHFQDFRGIFLFPVSTFKKGQLLLCLMRIEHLFSEWPHANQFQFGRIFNHFPNPIGIIRANRPNELSILRPCTEIACPDVSGFGNRIVFVQQLECRFRREISGPGKTGQMRVSTFRGFPRGSRVRLLRKIVLFR